jgi:CheY-like chemotaxis protein
MTAMLDSPPSSALAELELGFGDSVLVVDDDDAFRTVVAAFIATSGADVYEATGVFDAIEIVEQRPVDFVLCDYSMPEATGDNLLAYLATRGFLGRFVLMSADLPQSAADEVHARGAETVSKWDLLEVL